MTHLRQRMQEDLRLRNFSAAANAAIRSRTRTFAVSAIWLLSFVLPIFSAGHRQCASGLRG